ncbi:MFS transporter [Alkalihalobacillus pseudalcaliphilus]|uniref:MFS transporter n=1 Tax=Alkalihalobacillus pseudalcaliphilus TaxID=79884 RepID=UPI00064E02E1|nr:MFS transporter [Alkalihalobacillus pseudalcaliphilus]KMK76210.1 hypothetical protein AB990_13415 [Alkalihalobacillus pseudalcaliphilus]
MGVKQLENRVLINGSEPTLWRNKNFLLLWASQISSGIGFQIYNIVMPLLIYSMSQSALAMSGMRVMEILPNVFLGMIAGVIVDRFKRKLIMSWAIILKGFAIGLITFSLFTGQLQLWSLFLLGFLFASSGYFYGNALHSIIPQLMDKRFLTEANAKLSFTSTFISMIGPGVVGIFLVLSSFTGLFFVQLLLVLLMGFFILNMKVSERPRQQSTFSFWKDLLEGLKELFANKTLLTPTIAILFINLASSMTMGVLIFFAVDTLGTTEVEVGYMMSLGAIGGLVGAVLIKKVATFLPRGKMFTYALLIDVTGFILLLFAQIWWFIGITLMLRTFAVTIININYLAIRQEFTPNHLLGRVAGTSSTLMKLAMPIGFLLGGLWVEWFQVQTLFMMTACIILAIFVSLIRTTFYQLK